MAQKCPTISDKNDENFLDQQVAKIKQLSGKEDDHKKSVNFQPQGPHIRKNCQYETANPVGNSVRVQARKCSRKVFTVVDI